VEGVNVIGYMEAAHLSLGRAWSSLTGSLNLRRAAGRY